MSSMPPTTETAQLLKMVSTRHSQEMGREAGRIMPPLREGETTLHLTEERHSRVSWTPLSRRMVEQLMEVPITERCRKTDSAQPAQGNSDSDSKCINSYNRNPEKLGAALGYKWVQLCKI